MSEHLSSADKYNRKLGLILFAAYCALYVGFVGIIVIDYRIMARPVAFGVNLAVAYGIGLIVAAMALASVYMFACRAESSEKSNHAK